PERLPPERARPEADRRTDRGVLAGEGSAGLGGKSPPTSRAPPRAAGSRRGFGQATFGSPVPWLDYHPRSADVDGPWGSALTHRAQRSSWIRTIAISSPRR